MDRDAVEEQLQRSTEKVMRAFLRRVLANYRPTDAALVAAPDDPVTLGRVVSWWNEEVDQQLMGDILAAYSATYRDVIGGQITETSMDQAREYLARVKNRIGTDVAEDAFNRVRVATAQGLAEGWSNSRLSERVAAELGWSSNRDYWQGEMARVNSELDNALDQYGPPSSPARETVRQSDPRVRLLQQDKSRIKGELDREESHWRQRSETIARTESTGASNHAANSALQDEGWTHKKWLAADDARTRPSHNSADGQVVPINEPFLVGGVSMMNPGDPSAPAGEVVNCRCTIVGDR